MPQSPIAVDGKLYALERENNHYRAAFYRQNGTSAKPEWRDVSPEAYDVLAARYRPYIEHWSIGPGGAIQFYNLQQQIDADLGHDLLDELAVMETEASFLAGTR